jgi:hypothetical protein
MTDRRLSFIETGNLAGWLMQCLVVGDLAALRADGGNIAVLRELTDPKGRSAVMLAAAAKAQSLEVTQWLVQTAGVDPGRKSPAGRHARHQAIISRNFATAQWLVVGDAGTLRDSTLNIGEGGYIDPCEQAQDGSDALLFAAKVGV